MKKSSLIALMLAIFSSIGFAGLTELIFDDSWSYGTFYHNEDSILYCDALVIKFDEEVVDLEKGKRFYDLDDIDSSSYSQVFNSLTSINDDYELKNIIQQIEGAQYGVTTATHIVTGATVTITDNSELFMLTFTNPIPVDSAVNALGTLNNVEYAHQPITVIFYDAPDDPEYELNGEPRWYFEAIEIEDAWDITHGSSNVKIGVVDVGACGEHEDLENKINYWDEVTSDHGTQVASVAAAETDNDLGVAGIGWETSLNLYGGTALPLDPAFLAGNISEARQISHIINFSFGTSKRLSEQEFEDRGCPDGNGPGEAGWWARIDRTMPWNFPEIESEVTNAVTMGVILCASAGNNSRLADMGEQFNDEECNGWHLPFETWPTLYDGVIGVSGTYWDDDLEEEFFNEEDEWNYGDNNDLVDVAAPGVGIAVAGEFGHITCTIDDNYDIENGTSFSSPMVAGLASLIFAYDPYENIEAILEETAEEIGQYVYTNGYNKYMGHGRINARAALEACIPSTPTSFTVDGDVGEHPTLSWDLNPENDIAGYKIYRTIGTDPEVYLASLDETTDLFIDHDVTISNGKTDELACYKITAFDLASHESDKTTSRCKRYDQIQKDTEDTEFPEQIESFHIYRAYPNPFNGTIKIMFDIPNDMSADVFITDLRGRIVSTYPSMVEGHHNLDWMGVNESGKPVSSGLYFFHLLSDQVHMTQKLLLIK